MKIRSALLLALFLLSLPACGPTVTDYGCADAVSALAQLRQGLGEIPANLLTEPPVENGTEFDPNSYFTIFTHLSMQAGYVLDFVYTYDWMGGYPTLYARKSDSQPFLSAADVPPGMDTYLEHIVVEDSPEGYLEYVLLASSAEQFYLSWHAGYNDRQIVCSSQALRTLVRTLAKTGFGNRIPIGEAVQALAIPSIEPVITSEGFTVTETGSTHDRETISVQVLTFSRWGGFYRTTFTFNLTFPHTILDVQQELLVPYDCGIMF